MFRRTVALQLVSLCLCAKPLCGQLIENSDLKLSPRYERAFRAVWNQPDDRLKKSLLCEAVELGTSGGFRPYEVKAIASDAPKFGFDLCPVEWLWAFDNRRDEATRKSLTTPSGFFSDAALPLLPYGFDTESPLPQGTLNAVFKLYDSDSKMDAATQYFTNSDMNLLNVWRLRRYCEAHAQDESCRELGARARRLLSDVSARDYSEFDVMFLWAAAGPPEPQLLMSWASAHPGSLGSGPLEQVLEAWKAPEAGDVALSRRDVDVLFRLGRQEPHLEPLEGERGVWPKGCLATPPSEDDTELLDRNNFLLAFCSARPELIARNLYWMDVIYDHGTFAPPAVFDREQDRQLLAALSKLIPASKPNDQTIDFLTKIAMKGKGHWRAADHELLLSVASVIEKKDQERWETSAGAIREVAGGIPNFVFLRFVWPFVGYFVVWVACLTLYAHSQWVQANVIWHPRLRRIFFLFNPLLTATPFLRRRLLRPFGAALRGDAGADAADGAYYTGNEVLEGANRVGIVEALPVLKGRVVLEGDSGLGKTMYLRRLAAESRNPVAYVRALSCGHGVVEAIRKRLPGWLTDEAFLGQLIYLGGLGVMIDGFTEAGPAVRANILEFVRGARGAAIVIGTQPFEIEWPTHLRILKMQPLDPDRATDFLCLKGVSRDGAKQFIQGALSAGQDVQDLKMNELVLSNPFDLTVIAEMLQSGTVPNLQALQRQQYESMAAGFRRLHRREFPLEAFSEHVYANVIADEERLDAKTFASEIAVMAVEKMVVRREVQDGEIEYTFRHDKVRDFFVVQVLTDSDRIYSQFADPRFRSAYLSLAMMLPEREARLLRNALDDWATDHNDHSLADAVRRAIRRRKREKATDVAGSPST